MIYDNMAILPHGLYIKQIMYIHQTKQGMIQMVQKKSSKNQLERATNPKFLPQAHKCSFVERLCKDVCKLILGRDMAQHNSPFLHIVSQEMVLLALNLVVVGSSPTVGAKLLVEIGPEGWTPTQQPPDSSSLLRLFSRGYYFYSQEERKR
jgi:hypothetical protein